MILELIDLQELGESALDDFALTRSETNIAGAARLVAKVELTYALAAKLAHREPTVEGTHAIWSKMVAICDQAASEFQRTSEDSKDNKTSLDRILDLRNAAERRRDLHD